MDFVDLQGAKTNFRVILMAVVIVTKYLQDFIDFLEILALIWSPKIRPRK